MNLERVTIQPDPYEPFLLSQGIRLGNLLFISGQAGALYTPEAMIEIDAVAVVNAGLES